MPRAKQARIYSRPLDLSATRKRVFVGLLLLAQSDSVRIASAGLGADVDR
jgi:hypothetical protein